MRTVRRVATEPTLKLLAWFGVTDTANPTPPTSMTAVVPPEASTVPRNEEIKRAFLGLARQPIGELMKLWIPPRRAKRAARV